MLEPAPLQVVADSARAATLLHPPRLQLIAHLREPDSASGLARKLGQPRQRINYHLRELERGGFLEFVEERRRGNCVERLVRATARSYVISPEVLGQVGTTPAEFQDRFSSAYLLAAASRAIRDVAGLRSKATAAGKRLATMTLETDVRFARAQDRKAFTEELTREIGRIVAKYHDQSAAGGRTFHLVIGAYPSPKTTETTETTRDDATR
jgi:DNA-binding transcriptional ArsR family regulator